MFMKRLLFITFCACFLCSCFEKSEYPPLTPPRVDSTVDGGPGDIPRDNLREDIPAETQDPAEVIDAPEAGDPDAIDSAEDPAAEEPAADPDAAQEDEAADSQEPDEEEAEV
jgi:hypothetical protein